MKNKKIFNVNISSQKILATPQEVKVNLPVSEQALSTVMSSRKTLENILDRKDDRLIVVVGPCSIHDPEAAIDYAKKLLKLSKQIESQIYIVMRVYFEKPRTTNGWKGLINDPDMNDSFDVEKGIKIARKLLIKINEMGMPAGTEALDPISPQYLGDLISWSAIGARTTESQTHREMASGLSTPVGFKNGTDGSLSTAINALLSVSHPHNFLGINQNGQIAVTRTKGNPYGHAVLRGGNQGPNYDKESITVATQQLEAKNLAPNLMIDCSHANSNKKPENQPRVLDNCIQQINNGNKSIIGFMLESNLKSGNQAIPEDLKDLRYGVSVTDGCIGWDDTENILTRAKMQMDQLKKKK